MIFNKMQILFAGSEAYMISNNKNANIYFFVKRALDIILSCALLLFLLLPMLVIWLAVALSSSGGGFFLQERVGRGGKRFVCCKFRTMYKSAPVCSARQMSELSDASSYITPIGRFLRSTSLDELPQLWNVLKGDMSLVGPRPLIADEVEVHAAREQMGVYRIRPGITGLAQVQGRNSISDARKVELDAKYLDEFGFLQDARILALTAIGVISRKDIDADS